MKKREIYISNLDIILFFSDLDIGGIVEVYIEVPQCKNVASVEHVVANISYLFHRRGDVKITLISPSQTPSEMLSYRDKDATDKGLFFIINIYFLFKLFYIFRYKIFSIFISSSLG